MLGVSSCWILFPLLYFFTFGISRVLTFKYNSHRNVSELLDNLLRGYDNSIRPDFGGPPTIVEIDIMVRSMGPVSEVDMTYSMDCYFRQTWVDKRLEHHSTKEKTLALSISMLEKIWKPDTYFHNGKQSYLHTITTPNKFVRLTQDGRVLYSSRLTVKASCPMNLADFPMDTQRCPLKLGSFGYTTSDVLYRWNANRTVDIAVDMKMSQFDLISTPSGNGTERMKLGEFSTLDITFYLQRHMGNFLIQVYGPCTLLVILSWVSFWLNREATADRVSLGVTTILTMTFLGLEARTDLPKVSYPTALDFFVFLSYAFIFATIIQFAIVHFHTKYGSGEVYFNEESSSEDEEGLGGGGAGGTRIRGDDEYVYSSSEDPNRIRSIGGTSGMMQTEFTMSIIESPPPPPPPPPPRLNNGGARNREGRSNPSSSSSSNPNWTLNVNKPMLRGRRMPGGGIALESINSVSKIDQFSRVLFPLSFMAINVFYWYSYLSKMNNSVPLL